MGSGLKLEQFIRASHPAAQVSQSRIRAGFFSISACVTFPNLGMRPPRSTLQGRAKLHNVGQQNVAVKRNLKQKLKPVVGPFAQAVRALRESLRESQEAMAPRLGLSLSGYKFWESGDRTPSGGWILKLRALWPDDRKIGKASRRERG